MINHSKLLFSKTIKQTPYVEMVALITQGWRNRVWGKPYLAFLYLR